MKELENFTKDNYDEEYAKFLKETFPKSVDSRKIATWRHNGQIPSKYYFLSPVLIHGLNLNVILLLEGETQGDVASDLGIKDANFTKYLIHGDMPEKYVSLLEERYKSYKGKKKITPTIKVVNTKHYFLEYEPDMIHLKCVHSGLTKNFGKLHFSKTMYVDGRIEENVVDKLEYEDLTKNPQFKEVTLKKAKVAIKAANKNIKYLNI